MRTLDWIVLAASLCFIVSYGLYRGRRSRTVNEYLLAGKTMPWYAMALSIMATQASAITFISTTGQAYVDGMRFVQFYFGLPVAMVILSATGSCSTTAAAADSALLGGEASISAPRTSARLASTRSVDAAAASAARARTSRFSAASNRSEGPAILPSPSSVGGRLLNQSYRLEA